mgnify:CR=1 FL=1
MIQPLGDNILLKLPPEQTTKTTASGIIVAADKTDESQKNRGVIMAVGEKVEGLKDGDSILYEKWGGTIFEENNEKIILIKSSAVLAKII